MQNLMEGLLEEMNRVREVIKEYEHPALNGAGKFAAAIMKAQIKVAEIHISNGDTIGMLQSYGQLKEVES